MSAGPGRAELPCAAERATAELTARPLGEGWAWLGRGAFAPEPVRAEGEQAPYRPVPSPAEKRAEGAHGRPGGLLPKVCSGCRCWRSQRTAHSSVVNALCPSVCAAMRGCSVPARPYSTAAYPPRCPAICLTHLDVLWSLKYSTESRTKKLLEAETA